MPNLSAIYNFQMSPIVFSSFGENIHDLSFVLDHLHSALTLLEEQPAEKLDYAAYYEARVFLKTFFICFRIVMDNISGIIAYFYTKNKESKGMSSSYHTLIKNVEKEILDKDLCKIIETTKTWFNEFNDIRNNLVHFYDTILISVVEGENGQIILGQWSVKGKIIRRFPNIREYLGELLCCYQMFVNDLLEHLDKKMTYWHHFGISKSSTRTLTILQGYSAMPLYWAWKYGKYTHPSLVVKQS